jgi:hypothetical protein
MGWSASLTAEVDGRRIKIEEAGEFQFRTDDAEMFDAAIRINGRRDCDWRRLIDGMRAGGAAWGFANTLANLPLKGVDHETAARIGATLGRMIVASRLWPSATWELCY